MSSVLIVGATRGLGASLTKMYAQQDGTTVYGTTRSNKTPADSPGNVKWIQNIDLMDSKAADELVAQLKGAGTLDSVIITAGFFHTEDLSLEKGPNWDDEVRMYTTSSIAPVFIVHRLLHAGLLKAKSKIVFVSSESGSITLRHEVEGGGNYAHHASKAALNMTAKLLSMDLKGRDIIVSTVHPGFMRTEMTKGVGFDKYWDEGGAVTPDEAARSLVNWIADLDISKTGQYWAPRGAGDIGTAEAVLGKNLSVPLQLPW